jgi:hypothetical protein
MRLRAAVAYPNLVDASLQHSMRRPDHQRDSAKSRHLLQTYCKQTFKAAPVRPHTIRNEKLDLQDFPVLPTSL